MPTLSIAKAGEFVTLAPAVVVASVPLLRAVPQPSLKSEAVRPLSVRLQVEDSQVLRRIDLLQTLPLGKSVILSSARSQVTSPQLARKPVLAPQGPDVTDRPATAPAKQEDCLERLLEALDEVREFRRSREVFVAGDPFESFIDDDEPVPAIDLANITFEPLVEEFKFPEFTQALEKAEALDENIREEVKRLLALVRGIRN